MTLRLPQFVAPIAVTVCACIAAPVAAQQVDPLGSDLVFVTTRMGVPVEGRFRRWTAQVAIDPRAPQGGRIGLQIQTASVVFADPQLTAEAQHPNWLDTARFPQAALQSTVIRHLGGSRYELIGRLRLKDHTHAVSVPLHLSQDGDRGSAVGAFTFRRSEFDIGTDAADVSGVVPDVQVRFKLALSHLPSHRQP